MAEKKPGLPVLIVTDRRLVQSPLKFCESALPGAPSPTFCKSSFLNQSLILLLVFYHCVKHSICLTNLLPINYLITQNSLSDT